MPLTLVLLAACSSHSLPPDLERFGYLEPACLAAEIDRRLSTMVTSGAEPEQFHALTEFFFEHYPFSERDLFLDESLLESVARAHVHASMHSNAATADCARLERALTIEDLNAALDSLKGPHVDGDRCAWRIVKALASGPQEASQESISALCRSARRLFGDTPILILVAWRCEAISVRGAWDPWAHWSLFREMFVRGRWRRLYLARQAMGHMYQASEISREVLEFGPELARSRFDPVLAALGRDLMDLEEALGRLRSGRAGAADVRSAADRILASAGRLAYEEGVRHAVVTAEVEAGHSERAAPYFKGKPAVLRLLDQLSKGSNATADALVARATLQDPDGDLAAEALLLLARTHETMNRPDEMAVCLHAALSVNSKDYESRSDAGRRLARHYMGKKDWKSALQARTAWKPFDWCGTCRVDMEFQREREIARCTKLVALSDK